MKVLLIRPNSRVIASVAPLGLGYVAEALRRERRDQVEILDARNLRLSNDQAAAKIREWAPDVVGLTAMNVEAKPAHEIAALTRAIRPQAKVVIGGPYAFANRETILRDPNLDVVAVGEGEETAIELFNAFEAGQKDLSGIQGIIYRDGGEPRFTGLRPFLQDLDRFPLAWDLIDPLQYFKRFTIHSFNRLTRDRRILAILTSRGCPYDCIFCHNIFGKKFRTRSAASVVEEIAWLQERFGVREIEIMDDSFNLDQARALQILQRVADLHLDLNLSFPNGLRGDRVDEELLDHFQAAGVCRVSYAIESASPRIQKIIKKNINLDKVNQAITRTADRGIITNGFFILGFPTETVEEMRLTVEFAVNSDLHMAGFFYLSPFPGTEVARMARVDTTNVDFDHYYQISANLSQATDKQLHAINKSAYRRFYMSPRRMIRILKVTPKNPYLLMNAALGLRLLFQDQIQ